MTTQVNKLPVVKLEGKDSKERKKFCVKRQKKQNMLIQVDMWKPPVMFQSVNPDPRHPNPNPMNFDQKFYISGTVKVKKYVKIFIKIW